jgi:hypothetical protein
MVGTLAREAEENDPEDSQKAENDKAVRNDASHPRLQGIASLPTLRPERKLSRRTVTTVSGR